MRATATIDTESILRDRQVDEICNRFEAAWKTGAHPRIEAFVAETPEPMRSAILRELVPLEIEYRRRAGESVEAQEYQARFPTVGSTMQADTDLGEAANQSKSLGKFQLLERVGQGAFGVIWRARDTELDRIVALKIPHTGLVNSPAHRERFNREAQAAAQLRHPGIVTVHEAAVLDGQPVIISDFVEGLPLKELLESRRLSVVEAATLVADVAEAMDYAHAMGLVHRDIKPGNILLDRRGQGTDVVGHPLLADFGLALRAEAETLTLEGEIIGTPAYMSPEQAQGEGHRVDARSDVYSLGVVLYELLAGATPFRGSRSVIIHQVLHNEPARPRTVDGRIPADLETICLKCLAKEPARRYSSARALADDLRRYLRNEPIHARPVRPAERLWRWCWRNPAKATGCVALVIVGFGLSFAWQQARAAGLLFVEQSQTKKALQDAEAQRQRAEDYRKQAETLSTRLALERGLSLNEMGKPAEGLLWLSRALQIAPAHAPDLQETIRANLGGYRPLLHPLTSTFSHNGAVWYVAYSRDGKLVATASDDRTAQLWDPKTGKPIGKALQHKDVVTVVAFHPDSRTVLSASFDGTAQLWDVDTQKPVGPPLKHGGHVLAAAISPDGTVVVTGSEDKTARLWDARTGKPLGDPLQHQGKVQVLAFSPNSEMVVTGGGLFDGNARVWDTRTGKLLGQVLPRGYPVSGVAFSADNRFFAASQRDGVHLFDAKTFRSIATLRHEDTAQMVVFSPDGKALVTTGHDRTARLWKVGTWEPIGKAMQHPGLVWTAAFADGGKILATGSAGGAAGFWDAATAEPLGTEMRQGSIIGLAFSPDGKQLVTACLDNCARLWTRSTQTATALQGGGGPVRIGGVQMGNAEISKSLVRAAFSPDHRRLYNLGWLRGTRVWNTATGKPIAPEGFDGSGWAAAVSGDGQLVCIGGAAGDARLVDLTSGELRANLSHPGKLDTLAFSLDGKIVLTGGVDRKARLWDVKSGKLLGDPLPHRGPVSAAAFSPNGLIVATGERAGTEPYAQLWDLKTHNPIGKPFLFPSGLLVPLAFSPRGTLLAGASNETALVWDIAAGRMLGTRLRHQGIVNSVAFSANGRFLVTASGDHTARLWEVKTGKPVGMPLFHPSPVLAASFHPDGKRVLTATWDGTIRHWPIARPAEGSVERILLWTQVLTGMELDTHDEANMLDGREWQQRRQRLEQLGGSPLPELPAKRL